MKLTELGTRRFIGDTETMIVHDRWNAECEDCLLGVLIDKGTARGFNPDESDQAFWEEYDYCPHCFDRSEPLRPLWAVDVPPSGPWRWDDDPPVLRTSRLIPRSPILSAGGAVSMEDEASVEGEAA